ncbi:MAG: GNAT family N-acetyltransferase [Acutalibacter sp.]|nr:GNAT family N-acetyltransferase [Acutalibacter sp.]
MLDIRIRPYIPSDYNDICRIHDAARQIELSMASLDAAFLPFSVTAEREDFFDYPHIDVATVDHEVVAFSAYTDEEFAWLYVSPNRMRQGIGKKLLERALCVEPDVKNIEVLCGNEPARKLYESLGFYVQEIIEGVMPGNESFHVKVYSMYRTPKSR